MMSLPIPGQAKTVSVTTEKAINPPSSNPRTVTTGIMMFFRRWTMISLDSLSPLALANFMKSWCTTSRVPARASRMTSDILKSERLSAGINRWESPSRVKKLSSIPPTITVSPRPVEGNHPSITAKTMIIISPTQKVGRLKPRMELAMMVLLTLASGFNPA